MENKMKYEFIKLPQHLRYQKFYDNRKIFCKWLNEMSDKGYILVQVFENRDSWLFKTTE